MKKEAYYFSHDANARNDVKLLKARRSLGLEAYAIYFCIIEMLREQADFTLPFSSIPEVAFDLRCSEEKVITVIKSFDLFKYDENHFHSPRLMKSMDEYINLKTKLVEAGRKGGLSRAKGWFKPGVGIKGKERKGNKNSVSPNGLKKQPKTLTKEQREVEEWKFEMESKGINVGNQNFDSSSEGMEY